MFKKLLFVFLLFSTILHGQEKHELELNIEDRQKDTNLVNDYLKLGGFYLKNDSLKSINYYKKAYQLSSELAFSGEGEIALQLGKVYFTFGSIELGTEYINKSIQFYNNKRDSTNEFKSLSRLVTEFEFSNEHNKALQVLSSALEDKSESDYFQFLLYNKLGTITKGAGEFDLALEYYNLSDSYKLKVDTTLSEVVFAMLSNDKNRGVIHRNLGSYTQGEYYLQKSLQKSYSINDSAWIARNQNSLALLFEQQGNLPKAIKFYEQSLAIKRKLNYNAGVATTLTNLGNLYRLQKQFDKAFELLSEADSLAKNFQTLLRVANTKLKFSLLYNDLKDYKKAYHFLVEYNVLRDSFHVEEKSNLMRELDAKYKNKAFKIEQDKLKAELESAELRDKNTKSKIKAQQNYILFGSSIGLLLIILVAAVIRSNFKRKKVNDKLSQKNGEITKKNIRIEEQSHQLSVKNREILDSINYARRIQQAILPPVKLVKSFLNESFVLYLPKDIVAGDFYWMEPTDQQIIFAAADCTGHGVPGAMVSVICNNGLNRSVREYGLAKPSEILNKTRDIVLKEFEKSEEEVADGMDISLVSIPVFDDKSDAIEIEYAGANNPLWIIRKGKFENTNFNGYKVSQDESVGYSLLEIKADKQPIGKYTTIKPYTNHKVKLKKGDTIYLFSDGYVDQFGKDSTSKSDKKFKPNNFRSLLFSIQDKNMQEQKQILLDEFEKWKGELEQVDDVCVIGVRL